MRPPGFFKPVDRRDVRMIQGRERLSFPFKAREAFGILGKRVRQHFDCHLAAEISVDGPIDRAHTAFANLHGDFVRAETGTWGQSQTAGSIAIRAERRRLVLVHAAGETDLMKLPATVKEAVADAQVEM